MQYTTDTSISQVFAMLMFCAGKFLYPYSQHKTPPYQTAVRRVAIAASAINVNDAVTMPYRNRLVTDTSQEVDRRVADDADSARIRTPILWLDASPDARIMVGTGTTMNKVKPLPINGNVQMIRQSG